MMTTTTTEATKTAVLAARTAAKAYTDGNEAAYDAVYGDAVGAFLEGEISAFAYLGMLLDATNDAPEVYAAAYRAGEVMAGKR